MKRSALLLISLAIILIAIQTYLPYRTAQDFIARVHSTDPEQIQKVLNEHITFHVEPSLQTDRLRSLEKNWYAFYLDEKLVIGPFPLETYKKPRTLNLVIEPPSPMDWIAGRRNISIFGLSSVGHFTAGYWRVSFER